MGRPAVVERWTEDALWSYHPIHGSYRLYWWGWSLWLPGACIDVLRDMGTLILALRRWAVVWIFDSKRWRSSGRLGR